MVNDFFGCATHIIVEPREPRLTFRHVHLAATFSDDAHDFRMRDCGFDSQGLIVYFLNAESSNKE